MIQIASIETQKAERLMKALCNHFARKTSAHYEGSKGIIEFGDGKCEIQSTDSMLSLYIESESEASLSRIKQVVINHLVKFTPDETLQIIWADDFQLLEFHDLNTGISLKYNLFIPKNYDAHKSYPMILFIHDRGVVSSDPRKTLLQGIGGVIWATPSEQAKHESFVLAPQYSTVIVNDESEFTPEVDATVALIRSLETQYSIDQSRLYTTGQSMGCMASIAMLIQYPDLFAAALLVAGQWDAAKMSVLTRAKMWIVVSEGDRKAFPGMNASMAALEASGAKISRATWNGQASAEEFAADTRKMAAEGNDIKYTVLKNGTVVPQGLPDDGGNNHVYTWLIAYAIEGLRDWLFAQAKTNN